MLGAAFVRPSPRLHAAIAAMPLAVWTAFHLWEQWAAFAGRDAWVARMGETSRGPGAITAELALVVAPILVWAALTLRSLIARQALPGAAREEDRGAVRVVGRLAPLAAVAAIAFLVIHLAQLWAPKLISGASTTEQWVVLTHALGRPEMLVIYAAGLSAISLHLAAAIPAALEALGLVTTPEGRRSTMLVSVTFGVCAWILAAQLVGWLGTGAGTFWAIDVIDAP